MRAAANVMAFWAPVLVGGEGGSLVRLCGDRSWTTG